MVTKKPVKKPAATAPMKASAVKSPVAQKATGAPPAKKSSIAASKVSAAKPAVKKENEQETSTPAILPKEKMKKAKLVRDSFTMPEIEYQGLGEVKKACLKAGFEVKKSELLRIGVALIRKLDTATLEGLLSSLSPLKAGRPKKEK
ncbi:MAG: hypothetical protein V4632_11245 [Pseudomonadota bacterium]